MKVCQNCIWKGEITPASQTKFFIPEDRIETANLNLYKKDNFDIWHLV